METKMFRSNTRGMYAPTSTIFFYSVCGVTKNQSKMLKINTRKITVNTQDLFDHSKSDTTYYMV